jgi:Rrf2 family protein
MLSKKAQYALKALSLLTERYEQGPILIQEIADRQKLPIKFLENILLELKKVGVLDSKKGRGGGYYLRDAPENITIAKIIRTIDGPIAMLPCVSLYFYKRCADCDETHCKIHDVFTEVRDATLQVVENKTLRDI